MEGLISKNEKLSQTWPSKKRNFPFFVWFRLGHFYSEGDEEIIWLLCNPLFWFKQSEENEKFGSSL